MCSYSNLLLRCKALRLLSLVSFQNDISLIPGKKNVTIHQCKIQFKKPYLLSWALTPISLPVYLKMSMVK